MSDLNSLDCSVNKPKKHPLGRLARLALLLSVLGVFAGLCGLGLWQWHRGVAKQAILQSQTMGQSAALVTESEALTGNALQLAWRNVRWRGHFDAKRSLLWQNKFRRHHYGAEILVPFYLASGQGVVLVNRGWLADQVDKSALRQLVSQPISGDVWLTGQLVFPESAVLLGENLGHGPWPKTLQSWKASTLRAVYGGKWMPMMVRLSAKAQHGFDRAWPSGGMTPQRHRLYAYQWWLFAVVWLMGTTIYFRRSQHEFN